MSAVRLLLLPLCLVLTGCPFVLVRHGPPVDAHVDPMCFQKVVDDVRWEGDPSDPATWDVLGGQVVPRLRNKVGTAGVHQQACIDALNRLNKAKVIDLGR